MSEENRSTHKLYEKEKIGEVQIADEVVAIIAGRWRAWIPWPATSPMSW